MDDEAPPTRTDPSSPSATPPSSHQGPTTTPTSFRQAYPSRFRPPQWPIRCWEELEDCRTSVRLYHQASDDVGQVKKCASQRELVNIGMRCSVLAKNEKDYSKSGYRELWESSGKNGLPPNIALYTKTPVSCNPGDLEDHPIPLRYRHVIHLIGYAFDTREQPDCQFFSEKGWDNLLPCLTNTMRYAFRCAFDLDLPTIVLSYVGGGAFGLLFRGDYEDVFAKAVREALRTSPFDGALEFMGEPPDALIQNLRNHRVEIEVLEGKKARIPEVWEGDDAETKLFVNAWDPHSHAGNGNKGDQSLDGYVGRFSAVSYLSCVDLNSHILENLHPLVSPSNGTKRD